MCRVVGPALLDAGRRVLCNQLRQSVCVCVCVSVTKVFILPAIRFFGPTDFGGWSYRLTPVRSFVRPSVRPFVRYQLSSETNHRISLIFCIKLAFSKSKKVTKPDFRKKKLFGPNLGNLGPNLPKFKVFGQLFKFESLNFSDFPYFNRKTRYLTDNCGPVAEKNF